MGAEDVRLCCRRNDDLLTHVTELMERLRKEKEIRKAAVAPGNREEESTNKNKRGGKKRKVTVDSDEENQ